MWLRGIEAVNQGGWRLRGCFYSEVFVEIPYQLKEQILSKSME